MNETKKKELVKLFLQHGLLVNPTFFDDFDSADVDGLFDKKEILVVTKDSKKIVGKEKEVNWIELDNSLVLLEKEKNKELYGKFVELLVEEEAKPAEAREELCPVNVVFSYKEAIKKKDIQDFVAYFNARYRDLEKMLRPRQELQNILSINRIRNKRDRETVSLIGMVKEKAFTKNKNLIFEVEDPSGRIKVLVNKNRPELFEVARDIVLDEVIGVVGVNGENIVFANNILWPEVALKELKKSPDECYAIFTADLHVGSRFFLPDEFNQFIEWISGRIGNEQQREIARKVKYIFIVGDLIDGVGVYPEQDSELEIKDIYKQYEVCAEFLKKIPSHIHLIICPGNHDAMRIAEPQPELYKDFAKPVWELPNVTMISNPAIVNIHASEGFPGFDVLLYHGYCFDYYVANVDGIRNQGGYDRADLIMQFLLQRRHLAPTHTSTLYIPDVTRDFLVIDKVPDFFVTGHIHNAPIVSNYKNITTMSCGCWQSKTSFQIKVGHNPGPARVPLVNLQTRAVKILRFGK